MDELELILIRLAELLKEPKAKITLTSTELAGKLGVSQQTSSRYLIQLEKEGLINRATKGRRQQIQLTDKGADALRKNFHILTGFFQKKIEPVIEGSVLSGLGEGAYYIKEYEWKILDVLGFRPYAGTLNVRIEGDRPDLSIYSSGRIEGFSHGGRHFGGLDLIPVELEVKGHKTDCFIAVPERTHHKKVLEVVGHINLRSEYHLNDGDQVVLRIRNASKSTY